jgi:hypothetical protein
VGELHYHIHQVLDKNVILEMKSFAVGTHVGAESVRPCRWRADLWSKWHFNRRRFILDMKSTAAP